MQQEQGIGGNKERRESARETKSVRETKSNRKIKGDVGSWKGRKKEKAITRN